MNTLYIITGPAGVGKSTISKGIANTKKKSVVIEGDEIYHQVVGGYIPAWKEGNHLEIFWKICVMMIREYIDNGYDVVFNYIVKKNTLERIKHEFKNYNIKFVVLLVEEETILKRDKERPEDSQMKERCLVLLNEFKQQNFEKNYILKTDNLSIEQTIEEIEENNRFIVE